MEFRGIIVEFIILLNTVIFFVSSGSFGCEPRPKPNNGQVVFTMSKNWKRAVEVYQCDTGYILTGQTKHTCIDGEWSGHVPSCIQYSGIGHNNVINSNRSWFSFRRILKQNAKRNSQNNDKYLKSKLIHKKSPLQTLDHTFQIPNHMIRDSAKEYLVGDYDLSCLFRKRHGKSFQRAPKILFANVLKYSKQINPARPNNKYLEAIYQCAKGYVFENSSQNRLYCHNGHWVGVKPLCVLKTTPTTMFRVEPYIRCPPDLNMSLAEGRKSLNFTLEQPTTNYDWDRYGTLSSGWSKNSSKTLGPGLYVITYTVRDQEDTDIASCKTTIRVTDDELPTVHDCPLYLEVIKDFSKSDTVPVLWPEPWFSDNVAIIQVSKTMEPGKLLGPGLYNVLYIAIDSSRNEVTCNFTINVKDRATVYDEDNKINETSNRFM